MSRSGRVPGLKDKATMTAAIAALSEAGWLRPDESPTGGRPRSDYIVNPRSAILWRGPMASWRDRLKEIDLDPFRIFPMG